MTTHVPTPVPAATLRGRRSRAVIASTVGTAIEWYDFFLYGTAAALVFPHLFFPGQSPYVGALASFGTQAVGFAARPVGAAIFGHFGDRVGRKSTLIVTLLLMGIGTFLIGLLPGYSAIGLPLRCCSCCCASSRGSASAANGAARCCCPWSGARTRRRGFMAPAGRNWVCHSACSPRRAWSSSWTHGRGRLRQLGLAGAVPGQHRARGNRPVCAVAGAGEPGLRRGQARPCGGAPPRPGG